MGLSRQSREQHLEQEHCARYHKEQLNNPVTMLPPYESIAIEVNNFEHEGNPFQWALLTANIRPMWVFNQKTQQFILEFEVEDAKIRFEQPYINPEDSGNYRYTDSFDVEFMNQHTQLSNGVALIFSSADYEPKTQTVTIYF